MGMVTCPSCQTTLELTIGGAATRSSYRLFEDERSAAARAFIAPLSGRFTFASLREMYDARQGDAGWPLLSDKGLARALRVAGATPWRSNTERGWEL